MNGEAVFSFLSVLLRNFAMPTTRCNYCATQSRTMTAQSSGAKARKRASSGGGGRAKHVAQELCRTKKTRIAEGQRICDLLLGLFEAIGSGRASEGLTLSPAVTWGVAPGAAQTSMQGTLWPSHEGASHEDHRVGWR